jgi:hypothetical protein
VQRSYAHRRERSSRAAVGHIVALGADVPRQTLAEKYTAALSDLDHAEAICSELGVVAAAAELRKRIKG